RGIFDEALDVVLRAWRGEEFTHAGRHFEIPNVRIWPAPMHPPGEVLLHAVNSPESMARAIGRGLPALMARPLSPFAEQVEEFARYRAALAAAGVDAAPVLARATVLKYAFLAPTRAEARVRREDRAAARRRDRAAAPVDGTGWRAPRPPRPLDAALRRGGDAALSLGDAPAGTPAMFGFRISPPTP